MMKIWITILLVLTGVTTRGQKQQPQELGIGFAVATEPYQFEDLSHPKAIYSDKELKKRLNTAKIYPFFYKPDYGLYHFICLEKTNNYYKVLVNDKEVAFIPNDSNFYFKTWDAILLQSVVERLTKDNPIRESWSDYSTIIQNNCEFDRLTVRDVIEKDGDYWLSVSFSPACEDYPDDNAQLTHGWIKWRIQDKLLVNILLIC